MDADDKPTQRHIQPYQYHRLAHDRVAIVNPDGAKLILHKSQIQHKLQGEEIILRDLTAHERVMLETAWAVLEGKAK